MFRIRYKVASFLLVIGLAIAFSTVVNIVVIQHFFDKQTEKYSTEESSSGTMIYGSILLDSMSESFTDPETGYYDWKEILASIAPEDATSDFYLTTSAYIDLADTDYVTAILLYQYKGIGDSITEQYQVRENTDQVYVSEGLTEYVYDEDGYKLISIGGKTYEVAGILDENSEFSIVFLYDDLSEKFMSNYFSVNGISVIEICYGSESILEKLESACMESDLIQIAWEYNEVEDSDDKLERAQTQSSSQKSIYLILAVFSILDCGVVIEFWMIGRRRNLAILKAFGYSYGRIYRLLYTDFIKLAIPSLPIGVVIAWASFSVLSSTGTDMEFTFALSDILVYVLALALLALILTVIAVQHVPRRTDILDVIKED